MGGKEAVHQITKHLNENSFIFCSDIKSYYTSINHHALMEELRSHIDDASVITLILDYLNRIVQFSRLYRDIIMRHIIGLPLVSVNRGCRRSRIDITITIYYICCQADLIRRIATLRFFLASFIFRFFLTDGFS
jgi:hypothetical protein